MEGAEDDVQLLDPRYASVQLLLFAVLQSGWNVSC